jgi:hypothetical protein
MVPVAKAEVSSSGSTSQGSLVSSTSLLEVWAATGKSPATTNAANTKNHIFFIMKSSSFDTH